ncbi:MAG: DNA polymerase III subunit alpha, partial [Deltaproteobacteria bacterium]|nr:DNA polymerase III subunit alpha [Deltaproteobacteria bacterium]
KPRVDHELLERYSEGLIVLSGCLSSELAALVSNEDMAGARKLLQFYASTFPNSFYLEVQPHPISEQQKHNLGCIELAKEMGLPLVATTDCHYSSKDDHYAQEVLMCISTGKVITDPDRMRHEGVDLHLKTYQEMAEEFGEWPYVEESLRNTLEIAAQCDLQFDFSKYFMPVFKSEDERQPIEIMKEKARQGLQRRLESLALDPAGFSESSRAAYLERLEFELQMIERMGFADYFLVVSDFIVWAKEKGIPVGPGRGSVAGSLVAYALRITEVDPIRHKLLFERFLNPDRISLPDIDVDFCIHGRDKVIQYVVERYGKDNVAQIATFGTLKAKAAIKDVGRALGISYAETDKIAQLVPAPRQGFDYSLSDALKMEKRLADYANNEGRDLIQLALKLEGLTRHTSTHAAGVVIGDRPLIELLPMMVDKDGNDVTQYSMGYVEKIGLVKFDFLGLKTLTVLHTALRIIEKSRGVKLQLEALPLSDSKTYSLLCAGNTVGVFQLESTGITEMTMRLKPNSFDDLVAILALYRPGPLDAGMVDHYIQRKHGREAVSYAHPLMKNILADTYGIILYQEQIMQLARELAGYSLAEADLLRKAMGKKIPEEMAKQKDRFLSGAKQKGIAEKLAVEIFNQMETFARYGFNRSHSAAYAMISFQTAYLKAHYQVEFMAALMSHEIDDSDKVLKNLNECRKHKIEVLPPDVNLSAASFSVSNQKIRYGLEAVKGIGEKAVQSIIEARESGGHFENLEDFAARVDLRAVNKRVVENLIKCGAFDFSAVSRRDMMEGLEDLLKSEQVAQRDRDSNQISLFDMGAVKKAAVQSRQRSPKPEWPINQKLAFEREALGFYISGHPLEKHRRDLKKWGARSTAEIKAAGKQSSVKVAGVVTALRLRNTKKGDRYASFILEDWMGTVETIIWPDVYRNVSQLLVADDPVLISGKLDVTDERCTLIADKMESLISLRDRTATQAVLFLKEEDRLEQRLDELLRLFQMHSGPCPVKANFASSQGEAVIVLRDRKGAPVSVVPSEILCDEVEQVFGRPVLSFY